MSRFEHRLRQEMLELAQLLAPGDLRPLRQPPPERLPPLGSFELSGPSLREPREPARWLGPLAAMTAIALLAGGMLAARNVLHARAAQDPPAAARVNPGVIAVTGMSAAGSDSVIKIISARSGRAAKTIRVVSDGNGIALAPDAKYVYVVGPNLWISQVSVVTGKAEPVVAGAYPAASPDSLALAYASGQNFTEVAVRDLSSGRTRSVSLLPLIGADSSLLNQGGLTWLGNGHQVVAVPEPDPVPVTKGNGGSSRAVGSGRSDPSIKPLSSADFVAARQPAKRTACGQQTSHSGLCVIVVDVRAQSLLARAVFVPHVTKAGPLDVLSGDLTAQASFVLAQPGKISDVVSRVTLTSGGATVRHLVTLPREAFAVSVAPDADQVLYLPHSSPTALWAATMAHGRLTNARELLTDTSRFEFDQAGW